MGDEEQGNAPSTPVSRIKWLFFIAVLLGVAVFFVFFGSFGVEQAAGGGGNVPTPPSLPG